jgi:hypothetical protein
MLKALVGVALVGVGIAGSASAQAAPAPPPAAAAQQAVDYARGESWLCRPGRQDAGANDHTTTVLAADGSFTTETSAAAPEAPIDCFYVYPTVSTDPGTNSDMSPDPAELNVIHQQFARFAAKCRVFAPVYRQVTLAGLRTDDLAALASGIQYDDVLNAWNHYLENDNQGRGFVLVSHSQGSFILTELIKREIDGRPIQDRMVSAMLIGVTVPVARDGGAGGAFQNVRLCESATQTGCLISYAAFRSTVPPPENSNFGRVTDPNLVAACVNPAALGGGSGDLHAYLSATGRTITGTTPPRPWVTPERPVETPWVSVPGLLTARCSSNEFATYLEVTVNGDPADPRTDDIIGDLGARARPAASWGLHLVDVNIAMGNLLDLVGRQGEAWLRGR